MLKSGAREACQANAIHWLSRHVQHCDTAQAGTARYIRASSGIIILCDDGKGKWQSVKALVNAEKTEAEKTEDEDTHCGDRVQDYETSTRVTAACVAMTETV